MTPPLFWFRNPNNPGLYPCLLSPLSVLWSFFNRRRWAKGAHAKLTVPVVCIGNINLGGTGKTPTVIEIVTRLIDLGKKPHIITRGYKGSMKGPVLVDLQSHDADQVGDEPLLLAAFAPCWVAKDRLAGANSAIKAGADVLVLDDGMQNPEISKDLTVLVCDAEIGFGNGRVFPAGPLRQPISEGCNNSDLSILLGRSESARHTTEQWPKLREKPVLIGQFIPLETGMDWAGLKVVAFAGIGRPQKFFDTLNDLGATIVAQHEFGDHAKIPLALLQRMKIEADGLGAQLVTTEKDAARLPKSFQQQALTLPVRLAIDDVEPLVTALNDMFNLDRGPGSNQR